MVKLIWQTDEQGMYFVDLDIGKAVIASEMVAGANVFIPRIYDTSGELVNDPGFSSADFETSEEIAIGLLASLDQKRVSEETYSRNLHNALERAKTFLTEHPSAFTERVTAMGAYLGYDLEKSTQNPTSSSTDVPTLEWVNTDDVHQADTIWGTVIIREVSERKSGFTFGSGIKHQIEIVDRTGVTLTDHYPPSIDFLEAEARAMNILQRLAVPAIDESHLDYIDHILTICTKQMAAAGDVLGVVRLKHIQTTLGETLP